VGTLYVVGAPAGEPNDLTRRALRILKEVALVVADDEGAARQFLAEHSLTVLLAASLPAAHLEALLEGDVALVLAGHVLGPSESARQLIRGALERQYPVVPIPGPSSAITALVLSGLPADSFVHLGELPADGFPRRELLNLVIAEQRSLLALTPGTLLPAVLADLDATLGDRPIALVTASAGGAELAWRGGVAAAAREYGGAVLPGDFVVVVGGAPDEQIRWEEDRLRAEIQSRRAAGLGVKEISQELARDSGWSRREIYQLALGLTRRARAPTGETDAV
jgi:16S rRNA (cytidine1402-2'-O)-methyltransferase